MTNKDDDPRSSRRIHKDKIQKARQDRLAQSLRDNLRRRKAIKPDDKPITPHHKTDQNKTDQNKTDQNKTDEPDEL